MRDKYLALNVSGGLLILVCILGTDVLAFSFAGVRARVKQKDG